MHFYVRDLSGRSLPFGTSSLLLWKLIRNLELTRPFDSFDRRLKRLRPSIRYRRSNCHPCRRTTIDLWSETIDCWKRIEWIWSQGGFDCWISSEVTTYLYLLSNWRKYADRLRPMSQIERRSAKETMRILPQRDRSMFSGRCSNRRRLQPLQHLVLLNSSIEWRYALLSPGFR